MQTSETNLRALRARDMPTGCLHSGTWYVLEAMSYSCVQLREGVRTREREEPSRARLCLKFWVVHFPSKRTSPLRPWWRPVLVEWGAKTTGL